VDVREEVALLQGLKEVDEESVLDIHTQESVNLSLSNGKVTSF
jgi:hypothetical protein